MNILFLVQRQNISAIKLKKLHRFYQSFDLPPFILGGQAIADLYRLCDLCLLFNEKIAFTLFTEIEEFPIPLPELKEDMVLEEPAMIVWELY